MSLRMRRLPHLGPGGASDQVQEGGDGVDAPAYGVGSPHPPGHGAPVQLDPRLSEAVLHLLPAERVVAVVVLAPHDLIQPLHLCLYCTVGIL